jgi:uroporphyrinogen-III synthase
MSEMPSVSAPLAGRSVWLTRPAAQVQGLQQQLELAGAAVFCLPLLVIEPVPPSGIHKQRLLDLDRYDLVFYVSSNAAHIGLDMISNYWPQYPLHIQNFAVGPGTAAVLHSYGLDVAYPTERMSSEAMLALPQLQQINDKRALIVRGIGGREILAAGLQQRGAKVDYAELYQRKQPVYAADYLLACYQQRPPMAVVVSSAEALDNLQLFFAPLGLWAQLPLFVSSERLAEHASAQGNIHSTVLASASDAAIVTGLLECCSRQMLG